MSAEEMPRSLLGIGSGAIGIEFASFYNTLGTEVTIVEAVDRVFPAGDEEIPQHLRKELEKQGMHIVTDATVQSVKDETKGMATILASSEKKLELRTDRVLLAVDVVGNIEDIDLESTSVQVKNGRILVDEWQRCSSWPQMTPIISTGQLLR